MKYLHSLIKERKKFQKKYNFDKYSIENIENIIGDHSTIELINYFNNEISVIKWFYSPLPYINNLIPNEYCKLGNKYVEKIQKLIITMDNNIQI